MVDKSKRSRLTRVVTRVVNIPQWSDWGRLKSGYESIRALLLSFFKYEPKPQKNNFSTVSKKLNLSEADLEKRGRALYRMSILMLIIAILIFCYFIYHLIWGTYAGAILTVGVYSIALGLAFRYNFWYFQIKSRKLGCTWNEWLQEGILKRSRMKNR